MTIQEQYKVGMKTFSLLFQLNSKELKAKLKEICGDKVPDHVFEEGATVTKTTTNDIPSEIQVSFFDSIEIYPFGINYKPEHGERRKIIEFNQFFKL